MKRHHITNIIGLVRADLYMQEMIEAMNLEASTFMFKDVAAAAKQAGYALGPANMRKVRVTITIQEVE